ncbi:MAG: type II toxin-antitoxin system HicB family antitoxin [Nevskia sp.]|jgi:predicted RNase H-like HicB family nuclease|nr:type II toxin-antitoxin system HicB family antitoxin [Nevskia sp.]MCK9383900.1 type II toxin-antitoxin system HicB family antitoxin [Nevskia sp.]
MQLREIKVQIRVVVEPDEDGFHAYCPDLKGLHACGKTETDVKSNVDSAIQAYFESLLKHHHPIPVGVLVSDNLHPTFTGFVAKRLHEFVFPSKQKSFIEEVSIPVAFAA